MHFCDYGCGREATHQFKNGKWCCGEDVRSCSGIKEKGKQTCLKNFGVGSPLKNKKIQEKRKQTYIERYGVDHPLKSKEVQEKMKRTCLEKYGVDNPFKNKEVQEKMKQTFLEKYGVDNPSRSKEVQEKMKKTYVEKYGVEYFSQNKDVQEKIRRGCMEKYGTNHHTQSIEAKEQLLKRHSFLCLVEEIKIEDNQFKVHCKNSNCLNSNEKGGWFIPTPTQINNRIAQLERKIGSGGSFFYCSEHCKTTCLAFNIHGDPNRDNQLPYTQEQLQTFRLEVLTRDNYICQFCGDSATDVHHEKPVKLYPESALDPDYAWSCCEECHYAKGHPKETECSTGNLAAVVCKPKKKGEYKMEQVCKWCGKEAKYFLPALGPLSENWCCEKNRVFCPKYKPPDFALEAALRELSLLEEIEERKRQEEEAARPRRLILANVGEEKMKPLSNWCDQVKAKEKGKQLYAQ